MSQTLRSNQQPKLSKNITLLARDIVFSCPEITQDGQIKLLRHALLSLYDENFDDDILASAIEKEQETF